MMKWLSCVCLVLLATVPLACRSASADELPKFITSALRVARGVGDALLRAKGAAELGRSVPELMPLIDVSPDGVLPPDGMLTLKEVETFLVNASDDPESVALLVATLVLLNQ